MDGPAKAKWVARRLLSHYGPRDIEHGNPVETLITTILSQNTNDVNRDRAYRSLIDRFGSLAIVREARVSEIADSIRVGGLHRQKALRIRQVLNRITTERGALDLSFLADLSLPEAMDWLLASPGVGKKTAGIVLLFSFDKPYFPVDTHIKRVTGRLGLLGNASDPHQRMNGILPSDTAMMKSLHLNLIQLGRDTCSPRMPECSICPLRAECDGRKDNQGNIMQG